MDQQLGRLEQVSLREVWTDDGMGFSRWLAQEPNLAELGRAIHLSLSLEPSERQDGSSRDDVICRDAITDTRVLIKNQLERTDHQHLGQLITSAAEADASTVIWVAEFFSKEHQTAFEWLNRATRKDISVFGLEVELWRIGNSQPAPKFNVVSKPEDWTKAIEAGRRISDGEPTDRKHLHLKYWNQFSDKAQSSFGNIPSHQPRPQRWQHFDIGRPGFRLSARIGMRDGYLIVRLEMYDDNAKAYFGLLQDEREKIEEEYGESLVWREFPEKKQSQIALIRNKVDPLDEANWEDYQNWHLTHLEKFYQVFAERVKALDVSQYVVTEPEEDDVDDILGRYQDFF